MDYRHVQTIGGPGEFGALRAIALDRQNRLYAVGDSEVKVFDHSGRIVRRWDTAHPGLSVAVAPDGAVWVGEIRQVEIFDAAGMRRQTWNDPARMSRVTAIGFTGADVLLADAGGRAIRRFDRAGAFRHDIGNDNPVKGFLVPNGVLDFGIDSRGIIHAANPGKHRVEQYSVDGRLEGHIGRFDGRDPAGFTGCCNPTNVAVSDAIYVTEKAVPRAKVYSFDGKLQAVIAAGVFDPACKNMRIALDSHRRVFVTDTVKKNILVFEPVTV
jgi:hypothetical protein